VAIGGGQTIGIDYSQINDALDDIRDARDALNALDSNRGVRGYSPAGTRMVRELRRQVRIMGEQVIVPAVKDAGHATGSPFDAAVADSTRAVNDWIPVVKVGKVQPKVSGLKRTQQGYRAYAKGQLAWGSERGPLGGARKGRHRGMGVNYYGHPRILPGRWIYPAISSARVTRGVLGGYSKIVDAVFDRWRWGPDVKIRG
jgi:hypothetical protein